METELEMIWVSDLADKDFKLATINIFKDAIDMDIVSKQTGETWEP